MKLVVVLAFSILLFGCATSKGPAPEGSSGPKDSTSDSVTKGNYPSGLNSSFLRAPSQAKNSADSTPEGSPGRADSNSDSVTKGNYPSVLNFSFLHPSQTQNSVDPAAKKRRGTAATLADSGTTGRFPQLFYAASIDGKDIPSSYNTSQAGDLGKSYDLLTRYVSRRVEIKPQRVKIIGIYVGASPVTTLFKTSEGRTPIGGVVEFTPEPGGAYIVRGELGDKGAVWIEDEDTHSVVTEKVVTESPDAE